MPQVYQSHATNLVMCVGDVPCCWSLNLTQEGAVIGPCKSNLTREIFDSGAPLQWVCRHPRCIEKWSSCGIVSQVLHVAHTHELNPKKRAPTFQNLILFVHNGVRSSGVIEACPRITRSRKFFAYQHYCNLRTSKALFAKNAQFLSTYCNYYFFGKWQLLNGRFKDGCTFWFCFLSSNCFCRESAEEEGVVNYESKADVMGNIIVTCWVKRNY